MTTYAWLLVALPMLGKIELLIFPYPLVELVEGIKEGVDSWAGGNEENPLRDRSKRQIFKQLGIDLGFRNLGQS